MNKKKLKRMAIALLLAVLVFAPIVSAKYLNEGNVVWRTEMEGVNLNDIEEMLDVGIVTDSDYLTYAFDNGVTTISTVNIKPYADVSPAGLDASIKLITEKTLKSTLLNTWPVDSIFMNTSGENPSDFIGGTWVAWGTSRAPAGVGSDAFAGVETMGGGLGGADTGSITVGLPERAVSGTFDYNPGSMTFTPESVSINTSAASVTINNPVSLISATNGTLTRTTDLAVSVFSSALTLNGGGLSPTNTPSMTVNGHELTIAEMPKHAHSKTGWNTIRHNDAITSGTPHEILARYWSAGGTADDYEASGGSEAHSHGVTVNWPTYSLTLPSNNHDANGLHTASVTQQPMFSMTAPTVTHGTHTASVTWPVFSYTAPSLSYTPPSLPGHNLSVPGGDVTKAITDETLQPFITCYMWKRVA